MPPDELIRVLHASYAAPHEGVTDAELLARCAAGKDDAAFELLMRRHAEMVWRVCRSVLRDSHAAEDAFQATFLLVARNAGAFSGRGTAAGWLYRIARHVALKARARRTEAPAEIDPDSVPSADAPDAVPADLAHLLHEELGRLAEKYRVALVLCYLEGYTHAEAARRLGWPVGTVATRVARGRDRLRSRLARRGVALSSAGVLAALAAAPASASPTLVPATVDAIVAEKLSPAVHSLARGVQALMTPVRIAPLVALVAGLALAAGTVLAFTAPADPPTTEPPARPEEKQPKEAKPVQQTRPAGPGVQALAAASTDVVVAEVLETNPRRAIEGARDTARFKVVRALVGRQAAGDTFAMYYHLLWTDEKNEVLEPPKFQKGQRYLLFLKSHVEDRGGDEGKRVVYELTDQWLAVQPDYAGLVREAVTAVRAAHGDAAGAWSEPVGPLQARLVLVRDRVSNGTPIITAYLDLRNVAGGDNTVTFDLASATKTWTVTDDKGKDLAPTTPPGNGLPTPDQKPVTLPAGASARLTLSKSAAGIVKDHDGHLELASDRVWVFPKGDGKTYSLRGKIELKPLGDSGQLRLWTGTLDLPRVKIPTGRE